MIRSYSFQNSRAFPMACATFETTAQKTLGTLACSAIYDSFLLERLIDDEVGMRGICSFVCYEHKYEERIFPRGIY